MRALLNGLRALGAEPGMGGPGGVVVTLLAVGAIAFALVGPL